MYYVINKDSLREKVYEEVSRVADEAYSEDGVSLYDSVILTDKDTPAVERSIDDAVGLLVRRVSDICTYSPLIENETVTPRLLFNVPDISASNEAAVTDETTRYIVLLVSSELFQSRRSSVVPEYSTRAQTTLDNLVNLLRTRTTFTRT